MRKPLITPEELWKQRDEAHAALRAARQKLQLYRAQHSGEYIGGMEYEALIRVIDEALKPSRARPGEMGD